MIRFIFYLKREYKSHLCLYSEPYLVTIWLIGWVLPLLTDCHSCREIWMSLVFTLVPYQHFKIEDGFLKFFCTNQNLLIQIVLHRAPLHSREFIQRHVVQNSLLTFLTIWSSISWKFKSYILSAMSMLMKELKEKLSNPRWLEH